jgi:fructokinase
MENFTLADLIRGSDEDFLHIFALREADDVRLRLRLQDRQGLVYTRSDDSVCIFANRIKLKVPVPEIEPVSTIGAGDSFNAGLIYALIMMHIDKVRVVNLSSEEWTKIANIAIRFSQNVCMSLDNYISNIFAKNMI